MRQITTEIAVLGGGVVGCSVAWHLARRGLRGMTVFDRATSLGQGSTGKATGGFRAQFAEPADIRLSLLSREKLLRFSDDTGADSGYAPHGYLFLARSEAELAALATAQRTQHECGLTEARMVSAADARVLSPAVEDREVVGGAFCPTDGFIRPLSILEGYAADARRLGVTFALGVEAGRMRIEGREVVAVETAQGEIRARTFINAMGAWAGAPVRPVRRNVLATAATTLPETTPMTIWSGDWFHFRVRDGRILLLWPDEPLLADDQWEETVLRFARERVPRIGALPIERRWSGLYEMSPDEHALLGRAPGLTNLYLASGCSGHGVMHAPALGQLLAELIVDGTTSIDIAALDPARFALPC